MLRVVLTNWFYIRFLGLATWSCISFRINMLSNIMRFTEKNTQHNNELQTEMTGPQSRVFSRLKWACLQRNRWLLPPALSEPTHHRFRDPLGR